MIPKQRQRQPDVRRPGPYRFGHQLARRVFLQLRRSNAAAGQHHVSEQPVDHVQLLLKLRRPAIGRDQQPEFQLGHDFQIRLHVRHDGSADAGRLPHDRHVADDSEPSFNAAILVSTLFLASFVN